MLLELADETGVEPGAMLMIGDTVHDLQMAYRAGAAALGVTYGAHPRVQLAAEPALGLFDDVAALGAWLRTQR